MRRPDYEIYTFKRGIMQYWAFDVEYFGHYVARSEEEILQKVDVVKMRVANRLKEIEIENKLYYERLNRETEKMLKALREYKDFKAREESRLQAYVDKREMICHIRDMLLMGASNLEIMEAEPDASIRTISHVRSHLVAKKLL